MDRRESIGAWLDFVNWRKVDFRRARRSALPVSIGICQYLQVPGTLSGYHTGLVSEHRYTLQKRAGWASWGNWGCLPSAANSCLYFTSQSSPVSSSVRWCPGEAPSKREREMPTDKLDKLWRKLALYIGGREKDPEQAAVHHGQWSTLNLQQAEKLVHWQTLVTLQTC